ncbi:hypothetical protein T440DRAFT_244300 [Plenodomus tracheiphilus IPT5]|uniref:Uncharacterized protein n=1 Tax=Plenodomus tracheiphilus IPT5 TaxID=1408161 RepID=A0A6A7BHC9_9PLEO|nr:hypothetical protein T440DRAFT_244300 [Plenodomus tracheiphilus IPT5]
MQFLTLLTPLLPLLLATTTIASGDPCCNYTNGGKCIQNCPGKRSLGLTSLASRWVNRPANALAAGVEPEAEDTGSNGEEKGETVVVEMSE